MNTNAVILTANIADGADGRCARAEWAARTCRGSRRKTNEDRFLADGDLFAVCDGVGGCPAGGLAAEITVAALAAASKRGDERPLAAILGEANRQVREHPSRDASEGQMATTATALRLHPGATELAHVGDSRAYLMRNGQLRRLTRDHSLTAELVRSGAIPVERARIHPRRGMILRAIGPDAELLADSLWLPSRPGDAILLASDGLTDPIGDHTIEAILRSGRRPKVLAEVLVAMARDADAGDDITALVVELRR